VNKAKAKIELVIKPGTIDGDRVVLVGEGDEVVSNYFILAYSLATLKTYCNGSRILLPPTSTLHSS
jgi:hypothetical protein